MCEHVVQLANYSLINEVITLICVHNKSTTSASTRQSVRVVALVVLITSPDPVV